MIPHSVTLHVTCAMPHCSSFQMNNQKIHGDPSSMSMREVMSQTIAQSVWGVLRVLSGNKSKGDEYVDVDELSHHLLSQFGEVVNRHELPKPPPVNLRKVEQEIMKVRRRNTKEGGNIFYTFGFNTFCC